MVELALDDVQWDAFAGHLDGVSVAQLVGREAPSDTGGDAALPKRRAGRGG